MDEEKEINFYIEKNKEKELANKDIEKAYKKAKNLKNKIVDFKLLLSMFKDGISGKYKISGSTLATIGGLIAYVVSPIDVIPDLFPIIGWTDDIAVVGFVISNLSKEITKYQAFKKEKIYE